MGMQLPLFTKFYFTLLPYPVSCSSHGQCWRRILHAIDHDPVFEMGKRPGQLPQQPVVKPNVLTGACPPTLTATTLARLCYDTLLEHGVAARLAVLNQVVTPSVEAVVEANTLLRHRVLYHGKLIHTKNEIKRIQFQTSTIDKYVDFKEIIKPHRKTGALN